MLVLWKRPSVAQWMKSRWEKELSAVFAACAAALAPPTAAGVTESGLARSLGSLQDQLKKI